MQSLYSFSERALSIVASCVGRCDAVVLRSRRLKPPIAVVFEGRIVLVDPARAGLRDFCLAAYLLRWRGAAREAHNRGISRDSHFGTSVVRPWIRDAVPQLIRDFPKLLRCEGQFELPWEKTWPQLSWRQAELQPLASLFPADATTGATGGFGWQRTDSVEMPGNQEDYQAFLAALDRGQFPLEHEPYLREMPVARLPLRVTTIAGPGPHFEAYEREVKSHPQNQKIVDNLVECYLRKSESETPYVAPGERQTTGVVLDTTRLVEAVMAQRVGLSPRAFYDPSSTERMFHFQPDRHLNAIAVDLNGLRPGGFDDPAFSYRVLGVLCEAHRQLGTRCSVLGYSDHIVRTAKQGMVYIHCPVVLKDFDDDWDAAFYNRLQSVIERPPSFPEPAAPACFHPLLVRTTLQRMNDQNALAQFDHQGILLAAKRGMPYWAEFASPEFHVRTAQAVDELLSEQQQALDGVFETLGLFLPESLRVRGRAGGEVAKSY